MENIKKLFYNMVYLITGCVITAFSVNYILKPNGLVTSGITGLAIILEKYININYSYIYYLFTFIILIIAYLLMGRKEIVKIIFLSIMYPTVLLVMQNIEFKFVENDLLLASIYFSIFYGIGVGMILRKGFSFGGTDTIARILNKKLFPAINVSYIMLMLDGIIIIISAFAFGRNIALYSVISQMIVTKVCDYVMFGFGTTLYKLEIISSQYEDISKFIMHKLGRGVTLFTVKGGYTNVEKVQMETVCSPSQSIMIQKCIKEIDQAAFVKIIPIVSVWGRGNRFIDINIEGP
ncbi:YitT family protein [Sedimentibacter hydroxybenzoicus DSM 7310]|uniref:YitT family protein n=1 Tax=Sedimentibacter hydroxybenzoicus DSM 7310 TaxID=1123245 RepID=A0A974BN45_SEDHY|nr:YitT family protein [Sedimentibacter hydroxybenzoicus]NYB75695.1 YitT family protein [Sedimentibacter hydroxybenzoicus DSM 7310]